MRDAAGALLTPYTRIDLLERVKVRKLLQVVHGQLAVEDFDKESTVVQRLSGQGALAYPSTFLGPLYGIPSHP